PPDLDATIRSRVGVTAYTLQSFTPPATAAEGFAATFSLGGRQYTTDFVPDPVDSADCAMVLEDGSPSPAVVAAPPSCTYSGRIRGAPGSMCTGSLINGRLTAVILMGPEGGSWSILPLSEVSPGAPADEHIVSSNDDVAPGNWRCGVDETFRPIAPLEPTHPSAGHTDGTLYCELAVEADYPYFQVVASNASGVAQDIATMIANVNGYYVASGANLRFR